MAKGRRQNGGDPGNPSTSTQSLPLAATQTQSLLSPATQPQSSEPAVTQTQLPLPLPSLFNCTDFGGPLPCFPRPPRPTKITNTTIILTSTISTNSISTATLISFSVTQVSVPTFTLSTSPASLEDTAAISNNAVTTLILVAITVFLSVVIIVILLCFFLRRRRSRKQQSTESSPGPDSRTLPRGRNRMGVAQFGEMDQRSLADPAGEAMYTTAALSSNPFTSPRSQQAGSPNLRTSAEPPRIPTLTGLPVINILPDTPPTQTRDGVGDVSSLTLPGQGTARPLPIYYQTLREEADRERYVAEASNASSVHFPIVEPARSSSEHKTTSEESTDNDTIASDIMDFGRGNGRNEPRQQPVFHSTRASSGVFPEQEEDLGVGSSRVSWDEGGVGWRHGVKEGDGGNGNGRGNGGPAAE